MSKIPEIGSVVSVEENGITVKGKVTSYTLDGTYYGSPIVEKKYFVHWDDGRLTKESSGLFYDRRKTSLSEIWKKNQ